MTMQESLQIQRPVTPPCGSVLENHSSPACDRSAITGYVGIVSTESDSSRVKLLLRLITLDWWGWNPLHEKGRRPTGAGIVPLRHIAFATPVTGSLVIAVILSILQSPRPTCHVGLQPSEGVKPGGLTVRVPIERHRSSQQRRNDRSMGFARTHGPRFTGWIAGKFGRHGVICVFHDGICR